MSDSGQKFIRRNRAPRVHISYDDPYDSNRKIEIPFVMGVMADLSGNYAGIEKPNMIDRTFLEIDMDNFENRMAAIEPGVAFRVENKLAGPDSGEKLQVALRFTKMSDFSPAAVARQVPAVAALLQAREQLANLKSYMDGKMSAEEKVRELLRDPQLLAALASRAAETTAPDADETAKS